MPDDNPDIAAQLLRGQRRQTLLIVAVAVGLLAVFLYVWWQERQTHHALCTYRAGLVQSVTDSQAFLRTHPHGFPGITAATIQSNIATQQSRVASLESLHCADTP